MSKVPLLETDSLTKSFGGVRALGGVNICVNRGEIVSLIGPNGSGKSTFFNVITGVYKCDHGKVLLDGQNITNLPAHKIALRGLSRTFQNIRLFNNLSVLENVLIGAHRGVNAYVWETLIGTKSLAEREQLARRRAHDTIAIFGKRLLPRLDHPVFSLSYANRRRVEIARALALDPKVLLLDEPTAGMNPFETAELVGQIEEVRMRGYTVVLIEHKLEVVNRISDRVVVLDQGAKIAEGSAEEVRNDDHVIEAYLGHPAPTA